MPPMLWAHHAFDSSQHRNGARTAIDYDDTDRAHSSHIRVRRGITTFAPFQQQREFNARLMCSMLPAGEAPAWHCAAFVVM